MNRLSPKMSRFFVPHLTIVLLMLQGAGYLLVNTNIFPYLLLDPYQVLHGQVWRLVTWLCVPTAGIFDFALMSFLFYLPIGMHLESVWGDSLYTLYITVGMVLTIVGAFALYGYTYFFALAKGGTSPEQMAQSMQMMSALLSVRFSPYYLMMSIFFAYAATFPDHIVLFMFILPIKMKWLGIGYGLMTIYNIYQTNLAGRVVIICSLLNFVIFFLWSQKSAIRRNTPAQARRRQEFRQAVHMSPEKGVTHHKCAVCGATDIDHPEYEFRYCSKCMGNYEYCQEHLFTHTHVTHIPEP